jgi:hypothetical protein
MTGTPWEKITQAKPPGIQRQRRLGKDRVLQEKLGS